MIWMTSLDTPAANPPSVSQTTAPTVSCIMREGQALEIRELSLVSDDSKRSFHFCQSMFACGEIRDSGGTVSIPREAAKWRALSETSVLRVVNIPAQMRVDF